MSIKAKGEVDIAKYPNGLMLTRSRRPGMIQSIATEPLPLHLFKLGQNKPSGG